MKEYIYRLKNNVELCRSASPVTFGDGFPQFSEITPEEIEENKSGKKKAAEEKEN